MVEGINNCNKSINLFATNQSKQGFNKKKSFNATRMRNRAKI